MRASAGPAVALAAVTVACLTVGVPTAAQAKTVKELNVCWVNKTPGGVQDLEVVADGPSYKTTTLDNGECMAWDVRPGQYKLTVEDVEEFLAAAQSGCGALDAPADFIYAPDVRITIKRQGEAYKAFPEAAIVNGEVTTNVKRDRRTSVTVLLKCVLIEDPDV